jgi:hypothetical protein
VPPTSPEMAASATAARRLAKLGLDAETISRPQCGRLLTSRMLDKSEERRQQERFHCICFL